MLEGVTSQCSVVYFDVYLEVLVEVVSTQEADNGFGVNVILVLRWLHWLRLDQEGALEAFCTCIVASHSQHGSHMLFLALLIGVQEAHVTFATAPEYIVLSTQLDAGIDSVLNLHDSAGHYVEVRVGRSTVHVALVAEYVGS